VLREVDEELGVPAKLVSEIGVYTFERLNQLIFAYHVQAGPGQIELDASELDAYREVPLAKLRPWRQGTGPALAAWLAARGYHPEPVDFGTPLDP
jgi:8-oxo-dGTP pyrophosphatase MutT (NUDIX family)